MKIAVVVEIFLPVVNGVVTSSINLAENLVAMGHEVIFIAPGWSEEQPAYINGYIPVHYIRSSRNWAYPGMRNVLPWNRRLQLILQREKVDILHITGPWLLTWACMRAARRLGVPIVHTFHTMLHEPSYILYLVRLPQLVPVMRAIAWVYYGLYMRRSVITTAPSEMACRQLRRHFPTAEVRRISNGVDVSRFERYARYEELVRSYPQYNHKVFIYVGRLGQEKSVDLVIDGVHQAIETAPEIRLVVVGEGPSGAALRAKVAQLQLQHVVSFLGRLPHAELLQSGLLHHARAFVTASTTENQPMTVIEAICCGTPAVVPDVEGMDELVVDNGLRFAAHDRRSLADALSQVASDDALHQRCAGAALRMKERFDGRAVAERFLQVYEDARAGGASAG